MSNNNYEYDMLRAEILQYLQNYQTVRNMMYIITATILGFAINEENNVYLYLLPLIVILPSYLIHLDFYNCVVRDATYLMVFYESRNSNILWETRLHKFNKIKYPKNKIDWQNIPYLVSSFTCILIFLFNISYENFNNEQIYIGFASLIITFIIFSKCKFINYEIYKKIWVDILNDEQS